MLSMQYCYARSMLAFIQQFFIVLPSDRERQPMTKNYRGFSIEQERDGSFSIYRFGYVAGHFATVQDAQRDIDWRLGLPQRASGRLTAA